MKTGQNLFALNQGDTPLCLLLSLFLIKILISLAGSKAQGLFNVLKKKYLRKRKELKDAKRSGTSADVVEKAERLFRPYSFLSWLDNYVQAREGRTNLPRNGAQEEVEIDAIATAESRPDDEEVEEQGLIEEPPKLSGKKMAGKKRPQTSQSSKDAHMNEMEFSLMNSLRETIAERRKQASQKEDDADDLFCKALASELKELPNMAKCMAKNEIRNVIFKYQMSVMRNQNECYTQFPMDRQVDTNFSACQMSNSPASLRSDVSSPLPPSFSPPPSTAAWSTQQF